MLNPTTNRTHSFYDTTRTYGLQEASSFDAIGQPYYNGSSNYLLAHNYDAAGNYLVTFDKPLFDNPWDYVVLTGGFGDIAVGAIPVWWNAISIQTADTGVASDNILGHYYPNILEIRKYK